MLNCEYHLTQIYYQTFPFHKFCVEFLYISQFISQWPLNNLPDLLIEYRTQINLKRLIYSLIAQSLKINKLHQHYNQPKQDFMISQFLIQNQFNQAILMTLLPKVPNSFNSRFNDFSFQETIVSAKMVILYQIICIIL